MNRKAIKAALALARAIPVEDRRSFYRTHIVTHHRGPVTPDEVAFSVAVVEKLPASCMFFHGGPVGLPVGQSLLPPQETGRDPKGLGTSLPNRLTHCYVTTSRLDAAVYAGQAATKDGGAVYRVQPIGAVEMDPEAIRTIRLMLADDAVVRTFGRAEIIEMETAFRCARALIVSVETFIPWAGSAEATRKLAASLVIAEDASQLLGPEGWAGCARRLARYASPSDGEWGNPVTARPY